MTSFKEITSLDWSSQLGALGKVVEGLDDIRQCISIILGTQKGSLPHRLEFGCDLWKYIDLPQNVAQPHIVREVTQALSLWEPRMRLLSVDLTPAAIGHYTLTVVWTPVASYEDSTIIKQEVSI